MKSIKISTRILGTFGVLVLLLVVVVAMALLQLRSMRSSAETITGNALPSVEVINTLNTDLARTRLLELRHVNNDEPGYMAQVEAQFEQLQKHLAEAKKLYEPLIVTAEERELYTQFLRERERYVELNKQLFEISRRGDKEQAKQLLGGESLKLYDQSSATLQKLIKFNGDVARGETLASEKVYDQAVSMLALAALIAVLGAAGAGIWLVRSIRAPLEQAVQAADRVANGDLSGVIRVERQDETGRLLGALERMQSSLVQTVRSVRQNAEGVASASSQIASGNADLSGRTEEQASALEETAASMEQLGSTVRQNADNARAANQMAMNASQVAAQGGAVVAEVVETMKGINNSSQQIADIITVIDSIAFQTNILALNAAVEAARAGEQGRGFAVVAGEVRTLAQRSAEAAKEIKALISTSVQRVEQGTQLVDKAGATMADIVSAISRVTDLMAEISAASQEQSQGVAQVGEAVTQMDQTTQQNAALVEESAAAAGALRKQAQDLVQAVAVFQLPASALYDQAPKAAARAAAPAVVAAAAPARQAPVRRVAARPAPMPAAPRSLMGGAVAGESATARNVQKSSLDEDDWETF
ncbi:MULTISPECIES: methyl-accepting chemotaxis protein [Comamonas]|uniref:methyl-accepting chemotaxis protein n=1 Tax=Comamonas TaxID=283 RepID=UPI0011E813EC|nr:methyl-accepting chemotaxis protein [Comamonas sp. Z1]TYK77916.1 HAMP domain-containing protein [Comamonas sp. Z1]BCX53679.1 methyl-accepting chemotaxis protein [Comamonas testosteroni]